MRDIERSFMIYYERINDDDDTAWTADFSIVAYFIKFFYEYFSSLQHCLVG